MSNIVDLQNYRRRKIHRERNQNRFEVDYQGFPLIPGQGEILKLWIDDKGEASA